MKYYISILYQRVIVLHHRVSTAAQRAQTNTEKTFTFLGCSLQSRYQMPLSPTHWTFNCCNCDSNFLKNCDDTFPFKRYLQMQISTCFGLRATDFETITVSQCLWTSQPDRDNPVWTGALFKAPPGSGPLPVAGKRNKHG